jgi:hypothetical protein
MLRNCVGALSIVFCLIAIASATDYKGKIIAFDSATRKGTLHVDDNDQSFELAKDCKIYRLKGRGKKAGYDEDPNGLKDVVVGAVVSLETDFVDGAEVATLLKIASLPKKKLRRCPVLGVASGKLA